MAKIKGVELKKLVKFRGHEGEELYQGDIYLNGKKIGFYSDGDWGGPQSIRVSVEDEATLDVLGRQFSHHSFISGAEALMSELVNLNLLEKMFKGVVKKGFGGFAIVKNWSDKGYAMVDSVYNLKQGLTPSEYLIGLVQYRKAKGVETKVEDVKIYLSPKDFIIN